MDTMASSALWACPTITTSAILISICCRPSHTIFESSTIRTFIADLKVVISILGYHLPGYLSVRET
jgi:hypothetical protein